jgi:hypothetical protein
MRQKEATKLGGASRASVAKPIERWSTPSPDEGPDRIVTKTMPARLFPEIDVDKRLAAGRSRTVKHALAPRSTRRWEGGEWKPFTNEKPEGNKPFR